ncbi:SMC-Scp complex subunit ScpB [Acetobacterium wieringae]|uniref:Segregation and condensation protein B n=1 Tax=Acetobacterium wieringae TaxID=52694 RepID=A0A1F2PHE1_9FIRM|nr:SMC-Scp complex subunit ScpB [Acetobacterium wieringae]MEA4806823.1 SMC-Scp complex subunit ScpB [Acetobacterium wieringae]OFV70748.1 segregation and condensation protein B [Acetobacterium wieringae]TYC87824.1 SMC-Scp complex subunit ScpB [Acetobacterium wieringae]UYO62087.1 SMC-Scp complex subunit ScpB [Acetobacterium wieringae]VUZ25928.1 Segregation and condensation protein B [Acetobacterium wieringae]
MNSDELAGVIEGILFGAGDGVSVSELCRCLDKPVAEVQFAMEILRQDYQSQARGIRLVQTKDTYQLSTKPEYYTYIKEITRQQEKTGLSRAALETLAIIAYRQPVTRLAVDELRGVSSSSAIQRLLDRGLICDGGRLEAPGRPILYKTTNAFLKTMGLSSLKEMPEFEVFSQGKQESFDLELLKTDSQNTAESSEALLAGMLEKTMGDARILEAAQ